MNRLNVKRIAVLASALLMGIAVAGSVSFSNIPIINSAGQPVVQLVVGSTAKPSDGIVAANIAAVLGNLAFTSTPVTATVNGASALTCVPASTSTCAITNQQVYLGVTGTAAPSGTYGFTALIGSVLNGGITYGSPSSTKSLQTTQYANDQGYTISASPANSVYTAAGQVPTSQSVTGNNNGGGVSFTTFASSTYDNLLQITSSNLPSLLSNSGLYGESENLWLTGFPVYDQASGVANFALIDAAGAYQVVFNKPIHLPYYSAVAYGCLSGCGTGTNTITAMPFSLLGQNWTIMSYSLPSGVPSATTTVHGGKLSLAQSITPLTVVYVGHNITSGAFTVQVSDLGQPANGISPAIVNLYYNGVLQPANTTAITPSASPTKFNVSGSILYVKVDMTAAGLYAYQKWAKLQLYSGVYNITDGAVYNKTNNPGWNVNLLWTNSSGTAHATDLQSIIIYNTTPIQQLLPGQSFNFIQQPAVYKATLVGDTLGNNYDAVTAVTSYSNQIQYANLGTTHAPGTANTINSTGTITNVTEPAQVLTVTSQIPNAFTYSGTTSSSVQYLLTGYKLDELGTALTGVGAPANVVVTVKTGYPTENYISTTNPLLVTLTGWTSNTAASATSTTLSFVGAGAANSLATAGNFYNITAIKLSGRALPGIAVNAFTTNVPISGTANEMASLTGYSPLIISPPQANNVYDAATATTTVTYNQQNGQPPQTFTITGGTAANVGKVSGGNQWYFFSYSMPETNIPGSTSSTDSFSFNVLNATSGVAATPLFLLNYSKSNTHANMTYTPSNSAAVSPFNVQQGFVSERGSKVASISPSGTSVTLDLAKAIDTLQFVVSPIAANVITTLKTVGPIGIGQSVPGVSGMTVANVVATCTFSGATGCTVSGASGLSATPSVTSAITHVPLNTALTPLAVLDSNANSAATLVVVGSKYVNSVAAQIFAQNPSFDSSFGPGSTVVQAFGSNRILVAGYTADQTVSAGNQFIQALLSAASS